MHSAVFLGLTPNGKRGNTRKNSEGHYHRKEKGEEILTTAEQYASLLRVADSVANFNLEYLLNSGLIKGEVIPSPDSTKKRAMVFDMTSYGMEAVEGRYPQDPAMNFNNMTFNAPVERSQIAAGSQIYQAQPATVNNFDELRVYIENRLDASRKLAFKPLLDELEAQVERDSIKPSTLKSIMEIASTYGPVAAPIIEALTKLIGLKS